MASFNATNQFVPSRSASGPKYVLYCAGCCSIHHKDTSQSTTGHLSIPLGLWFCSPFCANVHRFDNYLSPYDDPAIRAQQEPHIMKSRESHAVITRRREKYGILHGDEELVEIVEMDLNRD
jgi:hypothetical protein